MNVATLHETDRSPTWLMQTAIREYLDREERRERERQEDEQRWQRYLAGGVSIDHDGMTAWLDGLAQQADRLAGEQVIGHVAAPSPDTRVADGDGECG